jgi:hypothetical protein
VWVDGTFIDCSVAEEARANRCIVYREQTGEILADGLFVLNTSLREAGSSDLHYAAFGNRIIYLADARTLVPWVASERDPIHRIINERLRALAIGGAGEPIDCQKVTTNEDERSECVTRAFADRKPFYARYFRQGLDSSVFYGVTGDASGNVFEVDYDSVGWAGAGLRLPKAANLFDDNHIVVIPCPKPVTLRKIGGRLACVHPITRSIE